MASADEFAVGLTAPQAIRDIWRYCESGDAGYTPERKDPLSRAIRFTDALLSQSQAKELSDMQA